MSRSFKKTPIIKYAPSSKRGGAKLAKRNANSRIRMLDEVPNGSAYKRYFCQWNIHDVISRWTWKDEVARYYRCRIGYRGWLYEYPTFNWWAKFYFRK